jgi:hypothetical protein
MDDEVETRLLAAFAQYADELLKDLGRDRAGFWGGQVEVVDALLTAASDKVAHDLAIKLAQAQAFFNDRYGEGPEELIAVVQRVAAPNPYQFDQTSGECPICGSFGLVTGTSTLMWAGNTLEDSEEEWFTPSIFECRVCRLHLNSAAETEAVGFEPWKLA